MAKEVIQQRLDEEGGEGKGYKQQEGVVLDVAKSSEGNYGERSFLSTTWDLESSLSVGMSRGCTDEETTAPSQG